MSLKGDVLLNNAQNDQNWEANNIFNLLFFSFKGGDKNFIRLSNNGAVYCGKKTKEWLGFSENSLKTV